MANLNKVQRLTFIENRGQDKQFNYLALYRCECGNERVYPIKEVRNMRKTACGCRRKKEFNQWTVKHGLRSHPVYTIWKFMIDRCERKHCGSYKDYGARGISVCPEWHDIITFYNWCISNGWALGLQIDRIDCNGNYEPGNCRFVTCKENQNNRTNNRFLEFNGKRQSVQQWADELGITSGAIRRRLDTYGYSVEKALTEPMKKHTRYKFDGK